MSKRDIRVILKFLILPAFTIIFATCSITREDMYKLASTPSLPDIEVMGYQNEIGFYDFGSVDLYTTSFASFIIKNNGSGRLMIKGISFMEEDIEWFTIDTSTLSSIVSSGESTVFMIKFKPTMLMTRSVTVVISTNCLDKNPYTFVVKGTGSGVPVSIPDINVRQGIGEISIGTLIDFGNVQIGNNSSKVFTIENKDTGELSVLDISLAPGGGTNLGEFSIIAPSIPISLAQNEHTEFTVLFNPQGTGIKSATLSISNDDPDESPYTFGVQGNGVEVPQADINVKQGETDIPDGFGSYYFGYVQCDSFSRPTNFTIENTGTAPLNITSVTLTAGDTNQFSIDTSGMVFTLDPCGETVFTVKFLPLLPEGYKWATVTIVNDDPDENPYTFTVEGEGFITAVPDINVLEAAYDSDHDFGPVLLGSSKTEIFTIENTGTRDLNITSIVNKNPDKFILDDLMTTFLVPAGFTTNFSIVFTPTATSKETTTIEIYSDDPDQSPYKFDVIAYGTEGPEPDIQVKQEGVIYPDGSVFYFPDTVVGESSNPVIITIENKGTGDLELESIILVWLHAGDFDLNYDPEQFTLSPGSSVPVTVWFEPTKTGYRKTHLQINSNDPNEDEYVIKLIGLGM